MGPNQAASRSLMGRMIPANRENEFYGFFAFILFFVIIYFSVGFYLAHTILRIDHSCGVHEGSLPNTWSTNVNYPDINNKKRINLRQRFDYKKYQLIKKITL